MGIDTLMPEKECFVFFFGTRPGVGDCDWQGKFFMNGDSLPSSKSRLVFLTKQCVPLPPNYLIFGFWSLKGIFNMLEQALHFLLS